MLVLFGIVFGNGPESLQLVCTNNVNHAATHTNMKAMDMNTQLLFSSPPLCNLYKTFTKPFLYLSFQDEPLTRIQITCSVNPKQRYTCVHAHTHTLYLNAFKIWLEQNEFPPYKNTSEIDLCLFHFNKSMLMPKH